MHEDEEPLEICDSDDAISNPSSLPADVLVLARQLWAVTAERVMEKRKEVNRLSKALKDAKEAHNSLMLRCQGLCCLFDRAEATKLGEALIRRAGEVDNG